MITDPVVERMKLLRRQLTGPTLEYLGSPNYHQDTASCNRDTAEYAKTLPLQPLSWCPICAEPLHNGDCAMTTVRSSQADPVVTIGHSMSSYGCEKDTSRGSYRTPPR